MEVTPLSAGASEALLRHLLGVSSERSWVEGEEGDESGAASELVPQVVSDVVAKLAVGNPKLIRELVHCLVDQGLIEKPDEFGEACTLAENLKGNAEVENTPKLSGMGGVFASASPTALTRSLTPLAKSPTTLVMDEGVAEIFDTLKLTPQLMQHALGHNTGLRKRTFREQVVARYASAFEGWFSAGKKQQQQQQHQHH
jgi:hypothetical protein